ncbi:MAG: hypothetical protein HKP09_05835 [Enterobacterales bacterium]|nr:hypothetical protein [Enterobacterales bacterium]
MLRSLVGCLCLLLSSAAFADELKVPVGNQGDRDIQRPDSGMSKDRVEQRFGSPENAKGPVGDPPITIWKYKTYSVYFEYDKVIHTVLHK